MRIQKSQIKVFLCFWAAVLFSVFGLSLQAEAKFRGVSAAGSSETDTAAAEIAAGAKADCPSLETHYGEWSTGNELKAEFCFSAVNSTGVLPAVQLDILGPDGTNHNDSFQGTYSIKAGSKTETAFWTGEQTFGMILPENTEGQEITVTYELSVKNSVSETVLYPEFSCALIQSENQGTEFRASCRKITAGTQTGFSAVTGKDGVLDRNGSLFCSVYGKDARSLKLTVTPDDADTATTVHIYRLGDTADMTGYQNATEISLGEKASIDSAEVYTIPFAISKGRSNVIVVDAQNKAAGHRIFSYRLTWPEGGSPALTKKELDLSGSELN